MSPIKKPITASASKGYCNDLVLIELHVDNCLTA